MTLPVNHPLNEQFIWAYCPSVGALPVAVYLRVPFRCQIRHVSSCLQGAIITADAVCAVAINGGTPFAMLDITQAGSAPGQVNTAAPSVLTYANEGDTISITPAGAGGAAAAIFDLSILQV